MRGYTKLSRYVDTFQVLGEESRMRLCLLLRERDLCVGDLVRVTGIPQPRVSTHLGTLRKAGFVRDRRRGAQSFYQLASDTMPVTARAALDEAASSGDPTIDGDRGRLAALEAEHTDSPEALVDSLERDYSPGRTWRSLAGGLAALLDLGDVLDVGSGDGAAASAVAPYCRSLTCIDSGEQEITAARVSLRRYSHARAEIGDAEALRFSEDAFDVVLLFHTLTYAETPANVLAECARVLRPGGRLVLLCLDEHDQLEITSRYGERHPGFSPRTLRGMLKKAGLDVVACDLACREARKPYLQVVQALATKPDRRARQRR